MINLLKKSGFKTKQEQMIKDIFVEEAWTVIRGILIGKTLDPVCGPGQITYNYMDAVRVNTQRIKAPSPLIAADTCKMPFRSLGYGTDIT